MQKAIFSLLLMLTIYLGLSCENPFVTRDPEQPTDNSSTFINPTTPDGVFANLQIAASQRNTENFIRSFVDSTRSERRFEFVPDQNIAATHPGTFLNWSLENERQYLVQAFQATPEDSTIQLNFAEMEGSRTEDVATATITQDYRLSFAHSSTDYPSEIQGQAIFYLERNETGDWAIYRWEDYKTIEEAISWTELKVFFQ